MTPQSYLQAFFNAHPDHRRCVVDTGGLGLCDAMTEDLVAMFPELERVSGFVRLLDLEDPADRSLWPHWWCVTEGDIPEIVDPTRGQFGLGRIQYEAIDERNPPTSKCPNCGEPCYEHRYLCSEACERSYLAHLDGAA